MGRRPIPDMGLDEQFETISLVRIKEAIAYAQKTRLRPVYTWGVEWWYWLKTRHNQPEIWNYMRTIFNNN